MLLNKIKEFGLNDKEAVVYIALLELGEGTVQRISQKSKVKRTSIYDVLASLKEKGLVGSTIKKKRRYYIASDPRELESKMEERKISIKSIIPELLSISKFIDKKPKIKFFEGEEGIKEIYLDTLNYPDRPLWAWVTEEVFGTLGRSDFIGYYLSQRVSKKIWAYVIAPNNSLIHKYKLEDQKFLRQTRIEKNKDFNLDVEIDLYGSNKIGIMSFGEQIGLIIESEKLFNTLRSIFDIHWNNLEDKQL